MRMHKSQYYVHALANHAWSRLSEFHTLHDCMAQEFMHIILLKRILGVINQIMT